MGLRKGLDTLVPGQSSGFSRTSFIPSKSKQQAGRYSGGGTKPLRLRGEKDILVHDYLEMMGHRWDTGGTQVGHRWSASCHLAGRPGWRQSSKYKPEVGGMRTKSVKNLNLAGSDRAERAIRSSSSVEHWENCTRTSTGRACGIFE